MVEILPESRWAELSEILEREFDADLPDAGRANIVADVDEQGNVKAFAVVETLLRVGQIYSEKGNLRNITKYLQKNITKGSVIIISSDERFDSICGKFGFREVKGKVFRIDL